jgi:bifunctional enzyme CysN/CysC
MSLPSRQKSRAKATPANAPPAAGASTPQAVTLTLHDEIDASRGNMLVNVNNLPHVANEFEAMLVWMNQKPAEPGRGYLVKHTTQTLPATLSDIRYKMDVNTLRKQPGAPSSLDLNEIARVRVTLHRDIAFDAYAQNRATGAFILIDRLTNETLAAGMIIHRGVAPEDAIAVESHRVQSSAIDGDRVQSKNLTPSASLVTLAQRRALLGHGPATLWLTGLSASGKSTIARLLEQRLLASGRLACILDGDNLRDRLNRDLGFSPADRSENLRRVAEVARLMNDAGLLVITAFISPLQTDRDTARAILAPHPFFEIFIDTPLSECEARDPKNLYKKARSGEVQNFTGISAPYEPPTVPDLRIDTTQTTPEDAVETIMDFLFQHA